MYRDVVQWSKIRHRILVKGDSRRQVALDEAVNEKGQALLSPVPHLTWLVKPFLDLRLPRPCR